MTLQPVPVALLLTVLMSFSNANAASVQYSGSDVIGVSGLTVGGQSYDVIFHDGNYNSVLSTYPAPAYETNYSDAFAQAATDALHQFAITDDGFAGISASQISGCTFVNCWMSTTVGQNPLTAWTFQFHGSDDVAYKSAHADSTTNYTYVTNLVWVAAPVPVPAAAWLFGSALVSVGWMRRKKA